MTWLEGKGRESRPPGERLAALMEGPEIVQVPGAHNPLAGLLAKRAGFQALYVSGGALTASLALPDLGVMTLEELCFFVRAIYRATELPLIMDGDTGYGEAINVMRMVRELEAAGAAAVQIEDQMLLKKCGHLSDKRLIPPQDMAAKVHAARRARSHLRIIARGRTRPSPTAWRPGRRGWPSPGGRLLANLGRGTSPGRTFGRRVPPRPHQGRRRHRGDGRAHADPRTVVRDPTTMPEALDAGIAKSVLPKAGE